MNTNNTKPLQSQIAGLLEKSEMWLVLRMDSEGVHFHAPDLDHMALIGVFLVEQPELLKKINFMANQRKRNKN